MMRSAVFTIVILFAGFLRFVSIAEQKTTLNILGLFPFKGDWVDVYTEPSSQIAFNIVNNDPKMLTEYELQLHSRDTQVRCILMPAKVITFSVLFLPVFMLSLKGNGFRKSRTGRRCGTGGGGWEGGWIAQGRVNNLNRTFLPFLLIVSLCSNSKLNGKAHCSHTCFP